MQPGRRTGHSRESDHSSQTTAEIGSTGVNACDNSIVHTTHSDVFGFGFVTITDFSKTRIYFSFTIQ